jgi:hypothetical protein
MVCNTVQLNVRIPTFLKNILSPPKRQYPSRKQPSVITQRIIILTTAMWTQIFYLKEVSSELQARNRYTTRHPHSGYSLQRMRNNDKKSKFLSQLGMEYLSVTKQPALAFTACCESGRTRVPQQMQLVVPLSLGRPSHDASWRIYTTAFHRTSHYSVTIWGCDYRRGVDSIYWPTYTDDSEMQVIAAPPLFSTFYVSPQHPLNFSSLLSLNQQFPNR